MVAVVPTVVSGAASRSAPVTGRSRSCPRTAATP